MRARDALRFSLAGLLALALVACGGSSPEAPAVTAAPAEPTLPPTATPEPTATPKPYQGEGPFDVQIALSDGQSLAGTLQGQGTTGLLLLPSYPGGSEGWASFAAEAAANGYRVLRVDLRGSENGSADLAAAGPDILAAAEFMGSVEVEQLFIFTAGESAIPALIQAPQIANLAGIALLSPPAEFDSSSLSSTDLAALQAPSLWIAARFDLTQSVESLYDEAGSASKSLWIYEGSALRGTYIFESAEGPDLSARLLAFMANPAP